MKVHKDMGSVVEHMALRHDKLGNGCAAFVYLIKKTTQQTSDRIRKELDKRSYQTFSRKLFSIYRYKISNPLSATKEIDQTDLNESQSPDRIVKGKGGSKFSSCIHYYKRDLSPVREMFPQCSIKTPYRQNFSNYEANMMSKDFKSSLLKSMGSGVKCIQSTDQNRRLSTYWNNQDILTQKHMTNHEMDLDQFLPGQLKQQDSSLDAKQLSKAGSGISCVLRGKQSKGLINFDKLPKRISLTFFDAQPTIVDDESEEREDQAEKQVFIIDEELVSNGETTAAAEIDLKLTKDNESNSMDNQLDLNVVVAADDIISMINISDQ